MFTGLVEETGRVVGSSPIDGGLRYQIHAERLSAELAIGDSIAVNGTCLTVVALEGDRFSVEAVGETLEKTSLKAIQIGSRVNLELPMRADGRFGGHMVQGHVNAVATITQWFRRGENWFLEVELPRHLMKYVVLEGSIAIDGISLTVATLEENRVGINIIPHTAKVTNLGEKATGDPVNIEVDMIAKYLENLLVHYRDHLTEKREG